MCMSVLRSTPSSRDGVERVFAFPEGGAPSGASDTSPERSLHSVPMRSVVLSIRMMRVEAAAAAPMGCVVLCPHGPLALRRWALAFFEWATRARTRGRRKRRQRGRRRRRRRLAPSWAPMGAPSWARSRACELRREAISMWSRVQSRRSVGRMMPPSHRMPSHRMPSHADRLRSRPRTATVV